MSLLCFIEGGKAVVALRRETIQTDTVSDILLGISIELTHPIVVSPSNLFFQPADELKFDEQVRFYVGASSTSVPFLYRFVSYCIAQPALYSPVGHVERIRHPPRGLVSTSTLPPC